MEKIKDFTSKYHKEILLGVSMVMFYQIGFKRGFKKGIKFEDSLVRISLGLGGKK